MTVEAWGAPGGACGKCAGGGSCGDCAGGGSCNPPGCVRQKWKHQAGQLERDRAAMRTAIEIHHANKAPAAGMPAYAMAFSLRAAGSPEEERGAAMEAMRPGLQPAATQREACAGLGRRCCRCWRARASAGAPPRCSPRLCAPITGPHLKVQRHKSLQYWPWGRSQVSPSSTNNCGSRRPHKAD